MLNEVGLALRAQAVGLNRYFVNVVDTEFRQLIRSFMVVANVEAPIISKSFEMSLVVGHRASKRISYTNPYPSERNYQLFSNRPDFLSFKDDLLVLAGGEARNISMRFDSCRVPGTHNVLVFVNDMEGKNEECLAIRIIVT